MRAIVLAVVLSVLAGNAVAEWTRIGSGNGTTHYVDLSSIRRSGETARMWLLQDYQEQKNISSMKYLSGQYFSEFDCKNQRHQLLQLALYSERMGRGQMVYGFKTPTAQLEGGDYIIPDTIEAFSWKIACAKNEP